MPGLLPDVDPDGLLEYSVVYTDRALNHMSAKFQRVMNDISTQLKAVYGARSVVVVPGSGTFGMEAVARQFATGQKIAVVRNGWFSFRWSQIVEMGSIAASSTVLRARPTSSDDQAPFAPAPVDEVVKAIERERPGVVFVPHVETASGILLPDDYLRQVAAAVNRVDGLLVVDCIASGALWLDMKALGIDVLITAPQKGWSASPCCGLVLLGERARQRIEHTQSTSFACDLRKWLQIMEAYEAGGHAYHATLPTDALLRLGSALLETREFGLEAARAAQWQLGQRVRAALTKAGFPSVAAPGFEAPGVVVSYTRDPDIASGKKFRELGVQSAAGVPLQCDEPATFRTFRLGLFGLEKLGNVERTLTTLEHALTRLG
ncbi:MAG TPA: aminotransferase class V-fold PLP-dependent enzyme [Polyangiaceae bacterium]|nr:aminotransferase class V-fold PLP-dependent enzyme [Polyangiaceae bacterium]